MVVIPINAEAGERNQKPSNNAKAGQEIMIYRYPATKTTGDCHNGAAYFGNFSKRLWLSHSQIPGEKKPRWLGEAL